MMARFDVPKAVSRSGATKMDDVLVGCRSGRTTVSAATAADMDQLLNKTLTYGDWVGGPGVDEDN